MRKNDVVIKCKNEMMQNYLGIGRIAEIKIKKGFAILTSEEEAKLDTLVKIFSSSQEKVEFDIDTIEKGFTSAFHIAIKDKLSSVRSNIFIAASEEDVIKEWFDKALNDKKIAKLGEKKVISIVKDNKISYKAISNEDQFE